MEQPHRRVSDSTEILNDTSLEAGSIPRNFVSIDSPYLDDSYVKFFVIWFRQIIPLTMYTSMFGTKFISILQPSRFLYPRRHRPKALYILSILRTCRRDFPWRFFQLPIPGPRDPRNPFVVVTRFHSRT